MRPNHDAIQKALLKLPNPVAVLTVNDDGEKNGMVASWITQVSHEPPQVLVAVHPSRYTHQMLLSSGRFALNLLSDDQADRVGAFKIKGGLHEEKFEAFTTTEDAENTPYLADSAAVLLCKLVHTAETGDHTLFIGEVESALLGDGNPLSTITLGKGYSGRA
jgi:flavin reductase (DIM6/NTAB) family NADH-FMN oxidoreductase RutF